MKYDDVLATVHTRGEYGSTNDTERILRSVLTVLGPRLENGSATTLTIQLPPEVSGLVAEQAGSSVRASGAEGFLNDLARHLDTTREDARGDAAAVLSTLAEHITSGQLNQLLSQLPDGFSPLFEAPVAAHETGQQSQER